MYPHHAPTADAAAASLPESIVHAKKAQLDFSLSMSYGDYLQLDVILSAQKPLSPNHNHNHNEMHFIVQSEQRVVD